VDAVAVETRTATTRTNRTTAKPRDGWVYGHRIHKRL
jgi:hypothetical protein